MDAHCEQCDACRAELAELDLTEQLLAGAPAPELPRTVWHRVRPGQAPEPRFKPAFGIAACAAGIVLGVLMGPIQFSAEETGTEVAWSGTVIALGQRDHVLPLLDVYQTGQD